MSHHPLGDMPGMFRSLMTAVAVLVLLVFVIGFLLGRWL